MYNKHLDPLQKSTYIKIDIFSRGFAMFFFSAMEFFVSRMFWK